MTAAMEGKVYAIAGAPEAFKNTNALPRNENTRSKL
jgi:hypothetical protein